jgi:O-antigen/teichoic acid export membrane protein
MKSTKFVKGAAANLLSLAVMGLAGLALNSMIPRFYGSGDLGTFNQSLSILVVLGQLGAMGVQYSLLRYLPEHAPDIDEVKAIVWSGLCLTLPVALCVGVLTALGAPILSRLLSNPDLTTALRFTAPAVVLFSCNKLLLNTLNALQFNQQYAFYVGIRYALMLIWLFLLVVAKAPGATLAGLLLGSEAVLTILLLIRLRSLIDPSTSRIRLRSWVKEHCRFGVRAVGGGLAIDLNTRLDILMLSFYFNSETVGIYSVAAFFCEMLLQLPTAARRVIDPVLAERLARGEHRAVLSFFRRGIGAGLIIAPIVAVAAAVLFHPMTRLLTGGDDYFAAFQPFLILLIGAVVYGAFYPFFGLLAQAGHPAHQTGLTLVVLVANVFLNLALIPVFGLSGAAGAATLALICGIVYFLVLARRHVFFANGSTSC